MGKTVRFIVHTHHARRAGLHQDLRFQDPVDTRNWHSFAVPKNIPLKSGEKVLAIKTHIHSEEEALFQGDIPAGEYGGGTLTVYDEGLISLEKFTSAHIVMLFQGKMIKGLYHLVSLGNVEEKKFKQQQYLLFKSKQKTYKPLRLSPGIINSYLRTIRKYQDHK